MTRERFEGCLLGLALGDAMGAPHEGGPVERLVWRLMGKTVRGDMRWTDDTQMSLDIAESLIERGTLVPDDLAHRFAASYRWSRGYGPGAAKLLKRIAAGADWQQANRSIYKDGSYGNGAAMRAPVIGLFYGDRPDELAEAARLSAVVTHAHALGIEGAVLIASATSRAVKATGALAIFEAAAERCAEAEFTSRLAIASAWLRAGDEPPSAEVSRQLGHGIAASESCVTALYISLRFLASPFEDMQAFVTRCGGDVDTIGAMAGAVWGAARGAGSLPVAHLARLEQRERLVAVASALHERAIG